jgi:hypothetical protein
MSITNSKHPSLEELVSGIMMNINNLSKKIEEDVRTLNELQGRVNVEPGLIPELSRRIHFNKGMLFNYGHHLDIVIKSFILNRNPPKDIVVNEIARLEERISILRDEVAPIVQQKLAIRAAATDGNPLPPLSQLSEEKLNQILPILKDRIENIKLYKKLLTTKYAEKGGYKRYKKRKVKKTRKLRKTRRRY